MPISKDALTGSDLEISLAGVETRVGELDPAMEHVRQLLLIPSMLSPGLLRIDRSGLRSAKIHAFGNWQKSRRNDYRSPRTAGSIFIQ